MSEIHIHREHALGLDTAREVAAQWAHEAETKFGMQCTTTAGEAADTLEFSRAGASGTLQVGADQFDLRLNLGFLMSAFAPVIQAEIEKNLDHLLAQHRPDAPRPDASA